MHIYPIVIFIRYKSAKHIKWVSGSTGFLLGLGPMLEQQHSPQIQALLAKLCTSFLFGHNHNSRVWLAQSALLPFLSACGAAGQRNWVA